MGGTEVLTHCLPTWIEEPTGKLVLIPERAVVVKHVYQLAGAGYGSMLIVKKLIEEKVPPFKGATGPARSSST